MDRRFTVGIAALSVAALMGLSTELQAGHHGRCGGRGGYRGGCNTGCNMGSGCNTGGGCGSGGCATGGYDCNSAAPGMDGPPPAPVAPQAEAPAQGVPAQPAQASAPTHNRSFNYAGGRQMGRGWFRRAL